MKSLLQIHTLIARSHSYWGRKPLSGLWDIFKDIEKGQVLIDPFCGGGSPAIAGLMKGAKVIAGDLNPMSVFLTKVLLRPINLSVLKVAFEDVKAAVSPNILKAYRMKCPKCERFAYIEFLVWKGIGTESKPESATLQCSKCGRSSLTPLTYAKARRQLELSRMEPNYWFPNNRIHSTRKPPVYHHFELFTGRNLSVLSELHHAIEKVSPENCRDALHYVFTAMLYNCSNMQMFSERDPSSSRGWRALRFYVPPKRKEVNVWTAFEKRFKGFVRCKRILNIHIPTVRVTASADDFFSEDFQAFVLETDAFDLIRRLGRHADHVFIDPPYLDDIDYFAFSEFWGSWLRMHFDFDAEWHPRRTKAKGLRNILTVVGKVTNAKVSLAFAPKQHKGWNEKECIKDSEYVMTRKGEFLYDNSQKRASNDKDSNRYVILEKCASRKSIVPKEMARYHDQRDEQQVSEIMPYLQVTDHLVPLSNLPRIKPKSEKPRNERIRALAAKYTPRRLLPLLSMIAGKDIENAISNKERNKKAYHTLCYAFIRMILLKDEWEITYLDNRYFEDDIFGVLLSQVGKTRSKRFSENVAFVAQMKNHEILFCFDDLDEAPLKNLAKAIFTEDHGAFNQIGVMVVSSIEDMNKKRDLKEADKWQRGFFTPFDEIQKKCEKLNEVEYLKLSATTHNTVSTSKNGHKISLLKARVSANIPVGGEEPNHYKLRFTTTERLNIAPGQFVMIDSSTKEQKAHNAPISWKKLKSSFDLQPSAYLKRPFGIHRAFYPNFGRDYLQNLRLPPELSTVLHTVFPNEFDIFYKVLENGVGTKALTKLKEGDKVQLLGPLGKPIDVSGLRTKGYEEIHVIGGGVGMAPLIFMVQALRFYTFKVKAFIGIGTLKTLKHKDKVKDDLGYTFPVDPDDATIYIDDLIAAGVNKSDIYVSTGTPERVERKIPNNNFFEGFVSDQYEKYLSSINGESKSIAAFACGPMGMLKSVDSIAARYEIPLKVLMEKRMACGVGVCLSCVCETKHGKGNYSRVCVDGPVFDASDILWEKIN